jgi:exopolyphosphatase/guanosine-5'-triphosphate,3'-diphosphate pyrophosphatase
MPKSKKFQVRKREADSVWSPDSEHKYAAIDIGSNGVRLLLSKVITYKDYCTFTKESLVRMPIRLGADVFSTGSISDSKADQLVSTLVGFKHLIQAYDPVDYRACATSAMREATNGATIADRIRDESGLDLRIIAGGEEAEMIFASHIAETLNPEWGYVYIDVGGGSTELTFFIQGQKVASRSFPVGTVRMLNGQVSRVMWKEMEVWVKGHNPADVQMNAIGSGGNMNKLFRLAGKATDQPVSYSKLRQIDRMINAYTLEERIRIMHLRPDRADVITQASKIFTSIMRWGEIKKIFVPQFGLADGLVHVMHDAQLRSDNSDMK